MKKNKTKFDINLDSIGYPYVFWVNKGFINISFTASKMGKQGESDCKDWIKGNKNI